MRSWRCKITLLVLMVITSTSLAASENRFAVSLLTIGPGKPVYTWWGHTALLIEDRARASEYFINFGLFHFANDGFYRDFIMGRLYFMVASTSGSREIQRYIQENRSIIRQDLDLSPQQIDTVLELVNQALKPENHIYLYDHYTDNCATRPRDILNQTLDGALKEASLDSSGLSIRQHTRRFSSVNQGMEWLLMYAMGGTIDRDASRWESMFLPLELYNTVASIPGLVKTEYILHQDNIIIPDYPPVLPYYLLPFIWGTALAAVYYLILKIAGEKAGLIFQYLFFAICGLSGSLLVFMMSFTQHTVVHYNLNILLTPPYTLLLLIVPAKFKALSRKTGWYLLLATALLMLLLQPVLSHKNLNIILALLPLYLLVSTLNYLGERTQNRQASKEKQAVC